MLTTVLDIIGLLLVIGSAFLAFGIPAGVLTAGVCILVTSWRMARAQAEANKAARARMMVG